MTGNKPRAMIGDVPVWCAHDKIINCVKLKPNPKNPNTHPAKQIELLGKILSSSQGWRSPITVSKRSGFIVKGHGRLEAALKAGILKAPVDFQDYENEATEYADLVADNRLAELAEIDDDKMAELMAEINDLDIDIELTGFSEDELDNILPVKDRNVKIENNYAEQFGIIVMCDNEKHQEKVYNFLNKEGYNCKVVNT